MVLREKIQIGSLLDGREVVFVFQVSFVESFAKLFIFLIFSGCVANLPPSFTLDINNLVISERTPVGEVIFKLEGTDPENGPVHFGLHGTDLLKVNRDTGDVTVVKPLDREVRTSNLSKNLSSQSSQKKPYKIFHR